MFREKAAFFCVKFADCRFRSISIMIKCYLCSEMNKRTMIKTEDEIFHELTEDELTARKPLAYFGWEGTGSLSFFLIAKAYFYSADILLKEMSAQHNTSTLADSLIYPLFFNYRHAIESCLKALFFNYGERTEDARKKYLSYGHSLVQLWKNLKPTLDNGKKTCRKFSGFRCCRTLHK